MEGVEVIEVAGKGRGLCATKSFSTGQVIISARPYEHVVFNEHADKVCHHCLKQPNVPMPNRKSTPLLKCGHCKFARYCNRDCQKSAWEAHKPECAAIKRVFPNVATDQTRLAARLFWKKNRNQKNNTAEDLPISVEELESHISKRTEEEKSQLDEKVYSFGDYVTYDDMPSDDETIYQWFGAVDCNAISLNDPRAVAVVGVGIFLEVALMNHDCNPNCVAVNNGTKVEVRAIRAIEESEELCLSYINPIDTHPGRQESLTKQYYFTCKCNECENGSEQEDLKAALLNDKILKEKPESEDYIVKMTRDALVRMEKMKSIQNFERLYNQAVGTLKQQDSVLADTHVLKIAVLNHLVEVCSYLRRPSDACEYAQRISDAYEKILPAIHPILGMYLMRKTHGDTHPIFLDVVDLMRQCHHEMQMSPEVQNQMKKVRKEANLGIGLGLPNHRT